MLPTVLEEKPSNSPHPRRGKKDRPLMEVTRGIRFLQGVPPPLDILLGNDSLA
jgi:hypothetical protein